ncbi:cation diffusion facilitator family transporter [Demequina sediminicola]|uniref:cation diffusion facilitator family transporter n=1 Tax=Demequina sediminicola TaxID=1095026 RepID=UPI0007806B81|nr:cation transporter [Demequina sediminicola]
MTTTATALTDERSRVLRKRIRWIVGATIAYNTVEAIIALSAGAVASSSALIGFGLDSVVEVGSAAAVAWQFSAPDPKKREHITMRMIAVAFFALAAVVTADALRSLVFGAPPEVSTVGIWLAAVSLAIMPAAAWFERRTGKELGSATAVADARQLILCSYLSAALLVGLVLNATLGWWWADPVAAIVIAGFAIKEGREAWKGDGCCATSGALLHGDAGAHDDSCAEDACCSGDSAPTTRIVTAPAAATASDAETADACQDQCCGSSPTKN